MARLFIFDMGGVVSRATDVLPLIAIRLSIDVERFLFLAGDTLTRIQEGTMTIGQFWASFSRASGVTVPEDLWGSLFAPTPDPEVASMLAALRRRGRVVCGTNTIEPHYAIHEARGDYRVFDAVYASCRIGLVKPDPRFFRHILDREGAAPSDAFFTDDAAAHVQSARGLGIDAAIFTGAADLANLLRARGALDRGFPSVSQPDEPA